MKEIGANVFNLVKNYDQGLIQLRPLSHFSAPDTKNSDESIGLKK